MYAVQLMPYAGGSKLNIHGKALPVSKLGALALLGASDPERRSNGRVRGVWPWADRQDRVDSRYRSMREWFAIELDPVMEWLEGTEQPCTAPLVAMAPHGVLGDDRIFWNIGEATSADEDGLTWLHPSEFAQCASRYVRMGRKVIAHLGGIESANFAKQLVERGQQAKLIEAIWFAHRDLIHAGVETSGDNDSEQPVESAAYRWASMRRTLGLPVGIEAIPLLKDTHWQGFSCLIFYPLFAERHLPNSPANNGFAKVDKAVFKATHPDVRVAVGIEHVPGWNYGKFFDAPQRKPRFYTDLKALIKPLFGWGLTVVIEHTIARYAMADGQAVKGLLA